MIKVNDNMTAYTGEVTITSYRYGHKIDEKVIHNTGKSELFKWLLKYAMGESNTLRRPGKLCAYNANDGQLFGYGILYDSVVGPSDISGETYSQEIEYTFLIPGISVQSGSTIHRVRLFSMSVGNTPSTNDCYAEATLDTDISIDSSTNVEIK